jgi:hypothetical protein
MGRGVNRMLGPGLRHGTGNECEDRFIRFYQKGGDGEVDTNPLAMLAKGEIFQLAIELGVPRSILTAIPTPDLQNRGDAHNDEDELRELTGVDWTYSRVDPDTGAYRSIGTIERMARFLDTQLAEGGPDLFGRAEPDFLLLQERALSTAFEGFPAADVEVLLRSARSVEASSRHKMNPNCPALGGREELIAAGILTNVLPPCPPPGTPRGRRSG